MSEEPPVSKKRKVTHEIKIHNILEMALPFLDAKDLFEGGVCLVSKSIKTHCQRVLKEQCQKKHPILLQVEPNLTYGRYRKFQASEAESRIQWTKEEYEKFFSNYQILFEVKYVPDGRILGQGMSELQFMEAGQERPDVLHCQWAFPCIEFEYDKDLSTMTTSSFPDFRLFDLRFVMREKNTGKITTLLASDQPKHVWQSSQGDGLPPNMFCPSYQREATDFEARKLKIFSHIFLTRIRSDTEAGGGGGDEQYRYRSLQDFASSTGSSMISLNFSGHSSMGLNSEDIGRAVREAMNSWIWY